MPALGDVVLLVRLLVFVIVVLILCGTRGGARCRALAAAGRAQLDRGLIAARPVRGRRAPSFARPATTRCLWRYARPANSFIVSLTGAALDLSTDGPPASGLYSSLLGHCRCCMAPRYCAADKSLFQKRTVREFIFQTFWVRGNKNAKMM